MAPVILMLQSTAAASGQTDANVTISMKDVPLSRVMGEIEKQTGCVFLNKDVDVTRKVSIEASVQPLVKVLDTLFAGTGVDVRVEASYILISRKTSEKTWGGNRITLLKELSSIPMASLS